MNAPATLSHRAKRRSAADQRLVLWWRGGRLRDARLVPPIGDIIDAGDRVVVRQVAHGTGHGPELRLEFTTVSTMRNGKTILVEFFWNHAEALETLGLSE